MDSNPGGLDCSYAEKISSISFSWGSITQESLASFCESAKNVSTILVTISITWNLLNDISALSNLTNLTYVNLSNNQIADITQLQKLTKLTNLYLNNNQIINIAVINNMTKMVDLNLSDNSVNTIWPKIYEIDPNYEKLDGSRAENQEE